MAVFNQNQTVISGWTIPQIQAALVTAQNAYAQLMTGQRIVSVSYEGKSVNYYQTPDSRANLLEWIMLLQRALGLNYGRRALRPIYR